MKPESYNGLAAWYPAGGAALVHYTQLLQKWERNTLGESEGRRRAARRAGSWPAVEGGKYYRIAAAPRAILAGMIIEARNR